MRFAACGLLPIARMAVAPTPAVALKPAHVLDAFVTARFALNERTRVKKRLIALVVTMLVLVCAAQAQATDPSFTWSGGGSTVATQWSNGDNWVGGLAPAATSSVDTLAFPALNAAACTSDPALAACSHSTNDVSGLTANALQVTGRGYSLSGGGLTLGGGGLSLVIPGAASQNTTTLSTPITLGSDQTWSLSGPTGGAVNQTLVNFGQVTGNHALTMNLANGTFASLSGTSEVGPIQIVGANSS